MFPEVILKLIESLGDTRPAVRQAALKVFPQVCTVVENPDVNGIIPIVIKVRERPQPASQAGRTRQMQSRASGASGRV